MKIDLFELLGNFNFNELLESSPGIIGIFNYDTFKYEYYSKNVKAILGYDSEEYMNGGLSFEYSTLNNIHSDIITTNIFPAYIEYCIKYAANEEVKQLRFSYEYMVNTKSGRKIWCAHQSTIIKLDANGHPILNLFFISDISDTKKDDLINFNISKKDENGVYETIHSIAYETRKLTLLSSREMQILKLLCEGNSTPKIADKLNLSEHTVKTHRKNILQKMEVKNTMDIVKIAYDKGIF